MPSVMHNRFLGLPVYVWAVALAGGIVVGIYLRRRHMGTNAAVGGDSTGTDASGSDTSGTGDLTDFPQTGVAPAGGSAGFNEAPPPDWSVGPNANGHLDPAFAKLLRQQINKDVRNAERKEDRKKNKHAKPNPGGKNKKDPNTPKRTSTTHFPTTNHPVYPGGSPGGPPRR